LVYQKFNIQVTYKAVIITRHREKLRKERYKEDTIEDTIESHSCVCAHCGRQFPGENASETELDRDTAESEDNS
jgi:hypothetical protein